LVAQFHYGKRAVTIGEADLRMTRFAGVARNTVSDCGLDIKIHTWRVGLEAD
jgi:hypothetical protein